MAAAKCCPSCALRNKTSRLTLRQISFTLAVYLCEYDGCSYPEGQDVVEIVPRSLKELLKDNEGHQTVKTDLDEWLDDLCVKENERHQQQSKDEIINDVDLSKIINEICDYNIDGEINHQYDNDLFKWIDSEFNENSLGDISENTKCDNSYDVNSDSTTSGCSISNTEASEVLKTNNEVRDTTTTATYRILNFEQFSNVNFQEINDSDSSKYRALSSRTFRMRTTNKSTGTDHKSGKCSPDGTLPVKQVKQMPVATQTATQKCLNKFEHVKYMCEFTKRARK